MNVRLIHDIEHPITRHSNWPHRIPIVAAITVASIPVIAWYARRLDDGSDEPLGLLALALACALAWRDRHTLQATGKSRAAGALLILTSVVSIGMLPPMLRAVLVISGIAAWFGIHRRAGLMGLAVLSLPVIASLQFYTGYPMRLATAEASVRLLELGGVVASREGVNLEIAGSSVSVDPACSGIRMLWHGLAAAMALAAFHRLSWRSTLVSATITGLLVLAANIVRATWLALDETGRFPNFEINHNSVGLICFAVFLIPLSFWMAAKAQAAASSTIRSVAGIPERLILLTAAFLTPFFMHRSHAAAPPSPPPIPQEEFTFNNLTLQLSPLPPSPTEAAFAKSFPGSLASYRWGKSQVILRRVTHATRRLHPSRDCLRAAGFETTHATTIRDSGGHAWSRFTANRGNSRFIVHERITSEQDDSTWTDVHAWFWSALRHPLNGPWQAETIISS